MDDFKNFAYSTVLTAPTPATSGTTLTLPFGHGSLFPVPPFQATVWAALQVPIAANAEIIRVTSRAGDVFTIARAQEGTSARTVTTGDQISATMTKRMVDDIIAASSYSANLSTGTTAVVTHSLGTKDVLVAVYRISDGLEVDVPFTRTSVNTVQLNSAVDLAGHRVVVLK